MSAILCLSPCKPRGSAPTLQIMGRLVVIMVSESNLQTIAVLCRKDPMTGGKMGWGWCVGCVCGVGCVCRVGGLGLGGGWGVGRAAMAPPQQPQASRPA